RLVRVERGAALVDHHRHQVGAELHRAGVRRQLADQQTQQGGLAGAVGPDQANAIVAEDAGREVPDDHLVVEALGDGARRDHQGARLLRLADLDRGAAGRADLLPPLLAQLRERAQPALVAGAAGADALARPFGLALDQPVELVPFGRLTLEDVGRPRL